MEFWNKLKTCWNIITHKDFYVLIVTDRYSNGDPLATRVMSNTKNTQTAKKKLIRSLREDIDILRLERRNKDER